MDHPLVGKPWYMGTGTLPVYPSEGTNKTNGETQNTPRVYLSQFPIIAAHVGPLKITAHQQKTAVNIE